MSTMRLKGGNEMQLGQTIKGIRKENNLTQEGFAELFHVTRQTVSNWENEKSYPDLLTLIAISDSFNISLDKMLKEDIKMTEKLNKEIKGAKHMKIIIAIVVGLFVVSAGIWYLTWSYYKTVTEDKFQNGLSKYEYSIDESVRMGGYYIIQYDESTYFALPNQSMPGYFDFSTDFHAKSVACYMEINGEKVRISWGMYDGEKIKDSDILVVTGEDTGERKLSTSEKEQYAKVIEYGFELYNTVYR